MAPSPADDGCATCPTRHERPCPFGMVEGRRCGRPDAPPAEADPTLAAVLACPHRSERWCCAETTVTCALGRGVGGLVDLHHCRACVGEGTQRKTMTPAPSGSSET